MNVKLATRVALVFLTLCASSSSAVASAQVIPISQASPLPAEDEACELHVWASTDYIAQEHGLLEGFGAVGAIVDMAISKRPARSIAGQLAQYLDIDAQIAELRKVDIASIVKRPNLRILLEPGVLSWKETKSLSKNTQRRAPSKAKCYSELIISSIVYSKAALFKGNLYVNLAYRDFADRNVPTFALGYGKVVLEKFPARADDQADDARAEIRDAFKASFVEYAVKKLSESR